MAAATRAVLNDRRVTTVEQNAIGRLGNAVVSVVAIDSPLHLPLLHCGDVGGASVLLDDVRVDALLANDGLIIPVVVRSSLFTLGVGTVVVV